MVIKYNNCSGVNDFIVEYTYPTPFLYVLAYVEFADFIDTPTLTIISTLYLLSARKV